MPRCARVGCMRLLTYQVLSFFWLRWIFLKILENARKLLDDFVRESSMPAFFSRRDPNLRLSPLLKQDLSSLSGFSDDCAPNPASKRPVWAVFEQFIKKRSKTVHDLSGLSGFLDNCAQNLASKKAVWAVLKGLSKKIAQKPPKIWTVLSSFLDKPLKTVQVLRGFWACFLDKS